MVKLFTFLVFYILLIFPVYADEFVPTDNSCSVYEPYPRLGKTYSWKGLCLDGKASGYGIFKETWPDGGSQTYTGTFKSGKKEGEGIYKYAGGDTYEGQYSDNVRSGFGILSMTKNNVDAFANKGTWKGKKYVVVGWWRDDNVELVCSSKAACIRQKQSLVDHNAREEKERIAKWERDAPLRRICEAQKQTCRAQCGPERSHYEYYNCRDSCNAISCN